MNAEKRRVRAKAKARFNRRTRWAHGKSRNPKRSKPSSGPLIVARGAGSINAESDMQALVRAGMDAEAAALYDLHNRIRGCPKMRWGAGWMAERAA